jgi:rRNA processing protein Krr1/Pno1
VDDRAGGPVLGQGVPGWLNEVVHIGAQNEGRVIGSGGSVIRDLEARTGCSVKVQKGEGTCTIGGVDPEKVAAAKAEVQRICEASGNPVGGGGGPAGYYKQHECTETVSVYRRGGLVVGPQGVNIKRIKEESGAMVQVIRETEEAVVSGSKERVDAAVAMVKELIASMPYKPHELAGAPPEIQALYPAGASHAGGGMMGGMGGMGGGAHESVEQVPCPFQAGAIIGPRGAVIREISEKTGARVVVRGNEAVTGGERVKGTEYVEIKGTPEAVANAVAEVNRILEEKAAMRGSGGGGGGDTATGGSKDTGTWTRTRTGRRRRAGTTTRTQPTGYPRPVHTPRMVPCRTVYGGYGMPPHMPMGMPAAGGAWGHDPFAGAKQAAAAYDQGAHYAVPGAGDVGEVPPPPPPPPMGGGGDVGFVPSAADVGAPPPPPPPPA